ncbi:MAG: hypothetical protein J2P17_35720 [Mycobacterium sp.]|nr:hypothetical protein [Mycobacterium sp.]
MMRIASTASAAAYLALAIPATAHASPSATAAPLAATSECSSGADIGWGQANSVYAGGWIDCSRPLPQLPRTVDATLDRNGTAVAYNRGECYGSDQVCSAETPTVANPSGIQTWCSYSRATYSGIAGLYDVTKHECWNG